MWIRYECFTQVHIGHGHRTGALAGVAESWTWECPRNLVTCLCQMIREGDKCWRVSGECKKSYSGPGSGGGGQWWWYHEETAGRQKSLLKHKTESVTVFMPHWDKITVWATPWRQRMWRAWNGTQGHEIDCSVFFALPSHHLWIQKSRTPSWIPVPLFQSIMVSTQVSLPTCTHLQNKVYSQGCWQGGVLKFRATVKFSEVGSESRKWGYLLLHPQSKASFMYP